MVMENFDLKASRISKFVEVPSYKNVLYNSIKNSNENTKNCIFSSIKFNSNFTFMTLY